MNLDGSEEWVPENMAFDNNDVKSMNSPLIILSLSRDGTAGSDTGGLCVALNSGLVVVVYRLSVVLVCIQIISDGGSRRSVDRSIDRRIVRSLG